MSKDNYNNNSDGKVLDNGICYYPITYRGKRFSAERQIRIRAEYLKLLNSGCFQRAEELERTYRCPETWLTFEISELINRSNNGLARKLVNAFRHRGYNTSWLKRERKTIKGKNAGERYD